MRRIALCVTGLVIFSSHAAIAWDPNEGANKYLPASPYAYRGGAVANRIPNRSYTPPSYTPAPVSIAAPVAAPVAYQPPAPAPVAYTPPPAPVIAPPPVATYTIPSPTQVAPVRYTPVEQSSASAPGSATTAYYPAPVAPPVYTSNQAYAPAVAPKYNEVPARKGKTGWESDLGVEYFHDNYKESDVSLSSNANYGALVGSVTYMQDDVFGTLDLRASYGEDDYSSISGEVDGVPQWEFDNRILLGMRSPYGQFGEFRYFTGLGNRYYRDEFKGYATNLGNLGYDRRIFQLYIPFGIGYEHRMASGWQLKPSFEVDYMFYGNVSSRLQGTGIPGLENIENRQKSGIGLQTEFMFARPADNGMGYEFGPFLRYWSAGDSKVTYDSNGTGWLEPDNKRLQLGAEARVLF